MKKTILLLAALAGVGYYLHWFNFTTSGTGTNEHINITLDKTKIQQDEEKALQVLKAEQQRIQQDAAQAGQASGDQPANGDPSAGGRQSANRRQPAYGNQQPAYDPNQQSAGAGYDPNVPPTGGYDPYDTSSPAGAGQPRIAPPRSAKRPPPSDLDRGFE